jgi:hypothetical protein
VSIATPAVDHMLAALAALIVAARWVRGSLVSGNPP